MTIYVHTKEKEFHLYNDEISYIIQVLPNGHIGQLYYGKRVNENKSYNYLLEGVSRPLMACVFEEDESFSLQYTRQEYACYGMSDFGLSAFSIRQEDGSCLSDFKYTTYKIHDQKPTMNGLPHTHIEDFSQAQTLEVILEDRVTETQLSLFYTIFEQYPVITRYAQFKQLGNQTIVLEKAMSICLDLPDKNYEWLHLDGAWGRERHLTTMPLQYGVQSIHSLRGNASSAEHNPFIALKRPHTTETSGEIMGCSLLYSGNFYAGVEVKTHDTSRILMGIHPEYFSWSLQKGESFLTPEVVLVFSDSGLNKMSQTFHQFYRKHLMRGKWKEQSRPILLNNWETTAFDFTEEMILELAQKAAEVGIELFVLDDGWFGKRNHDKAGLGDWFVNKEKLPNGLETVIAEVHQLGMLFGLWIEPEMVNKDSQLYRRHPEWLIQHPKRQSSPARHQYVLDFSREDVYQNIYRQIRTLLQTYQIDYIKWDMNRYITQGYSLFYEKERQGEIFHRYLLNVYRLYEELIKEFPDVLFESCSSGGGRFDPGMLYYAPQTWTSDNTDAMERLLIQYGTSMVYPLISMGCHVSDSPNQQVGRISSIHTRANVAYFGSFGYELDLIHSSMMEREMIKEQIVFYKQYRPLFQKGIFYRLVSPFENRDTAWQVVSEDRSAAIVAYYRQMIRANEGFKRLYLQGLDPQKVYTINHQGSYYGDELMNVGIVISEKDFIGGETDFASVLYCVEEMK